jgi:hypothetical protein
MFTAIMILWSLLIIAVLFFGRKELFMNKYLDGDNG